MTVERTLSIVKPDGVRKNVIGEVYRRFEKAGLAIVAARMTRLSTAQAEAFYAIHRQRPFFRDLVSFMTSGPVMLQVLEGADAVAKNREIMGATDPKQGRTGHDSRGPRFEHRPECRARLGQCRERRR
jgi:nucleoside-diphosphate kinase